MRIILALEMGGFISISEKSSWLKALTASMFARVAAAAAPGPLVT